MVINKWQLIAYDLAGKPSAQAFPDWVDGLRVHSDSEQRFNSSENVCRPRFELSIKFMI